MSAAVPPEREVPAIGDARRICAMPPGDERTGAACAHLRSLAWASPDEVTLTRIQRLYAERHGGEVVLARADQVRVIREARRMGEVLEVGEHQADGGARPGGEPPDYEAPVMSGGVRYSLGEPGAAYPRGVYRYDSQAERWRQIAPLPYVAAAIITRDGSGGRSGTSYLMSAAADGPRRVLEAAAVRDGSWAAALGVALSPDPKVTQAAGAAVLTLGAAVEVRESVTRAEGGRIAIPPPECLPAGYLATSPGLGEAEALEHWRAVAELASPTLADMLGAAAFAPYVGALGEQSHIIDLFGDPGKGKTTALRVTAALFGDARGESGTLRIWDATPGGLTRHLGQLGTLPAFVDESGIAGFTADERARLAYRITGGASRLTADRRDSQRTATSLPWHGALIMTGNGRFTEGLGSGWTAGVIRRVLEYEGPFTSGAEQARQLADLAEAAYGHPGALLLARFDVAAASAALGRVRAPDRHGGEALAPSADRGDPGRTWAGVLAGHIAGAAMLDELLGLGPAIADPQWWPGTLAGKVTDHAAVWLAEHDQTPEHDADRMLAAVREAIAREPARWPTVAEYRAHKAPPEFHAPGVPADHPLPRYGIARDYAGVQADDYTWAALFGRTFGELRDALGVDEARTLRELYGRGVLVVADSARRGGRWTTPVRLEVKPRPPVNMYRLALPPLADDDDQADDDAAAPGDNALARTHEGMSAEIPPTPPTPQVRAPAQPPTLPPTLPPTPPPTPPGQLAEGLLGGRVAEAPRPAEADPLPEVLPEAPADLEAAAAPGPPTAPREYGPRDAVTVLMAHGRRVAVSGDGWELDGARLTLEQLEQAAADLIADLGPAAAESEAAALARREHADAEAQAAGHVQAEAEAASAPWLVLGADGRAYAPGGEVLTLGPGRLEAVGDAGALAALALGLGTARLWVPRSAREALGLPAEVGDLGLREGLPHRFTEAADPSAWDMRPAAPVGLAGWMTVYRVPRSGEGVALAFPEWLPASAALAALGPAELARALDLIHDATATPGGRGGVAYDHSPGTTCKHLLAQAARWSRRGTPEAVTLPPPYDLGAKLPRGAPLQMRPPASHIAPPAEVPAGWVLAELDVNSCYPSAATGTDFGLGEAEHRKAAPGGSLELPKLPGAHLVMVRDARGGVSVHPSLAPFIPGEGRRRDAIGWIDALAARWLAERGVPLEVLESYTWPERARVFDSVTARLGEARGRLEADGTPPAAAAAAIVKAMGNTLLGGWLASDFGGERAADDWLARRDWWLTVRVQAEVRKQRNLLPALEAGALVVLAGQAVDSVYVAAPSLADLEAAPGTGGRPALGDGRGKFKIKALGEVTPALSAVLADSRSRGLARLAAMREALGLETGK